MADQISLGEADDDDATDVTDDSALNTPLPDNRETVAFFDPLQPQDVSCDVTTGRRSFMFQCTVSRFRRLKPN